MVLKKLIIANFKDIKLLEIPFDGSNLPANLEDLSVCYKHRDELVSVSFIVHSNFNTALLALRELFFLISSIKMGKPITKIFNTPEITTVGFEYFIGKVEYKYYLRMSEDGVVKELLFIEGHLEYNSLNEVYDRPAVPKQYPGFFDKIFVTDLNKDNIVTEGCNNTIKYCCNDPNYLNQTTKILQLLNYTDKKLIVEEKDGESYMFIYDEMSATYIDVTTANKNIQEVLSLLSLLFPCLTFPSLVLILGFGGISFVDRMKLLKFFNHVSLEGYKSQLLGIDHLDTDVYNSSISAVAHASIIKDDDNKFIFDTGSK